MQANRKTREGLTEIEWPQIDFDARLIRLRAGHTKGGKPRTCPFLGNMEEILLAAKKDRDTYWPECPWVFHRLGQPLLDFRGAWDTACQRAGLQDLEFHDLRRSGVRNLSRAKVPETMHHEDHGSQDPGHVRPLTTSQASPTWPMRRSFWRSFGCRKMLEQPRRPCQNPCQSSETRMALDRSRAIKCFIIMMRRGGLEPTNATENT